MQLRLHVELEVHDVAVLDDVFLALLAELAGLAIQSKAHDGIDGRLLLTWIATCTFVELYKNIR